MGDVELRRAVVLGTWIAFLTYFPTTSLPAPIAIAIRPLWALKSACKIERYMTLG